MEAHLSLAPLENSYNVFDLPSELVSYQTDKLNRIRSEVASSTLTLDDLYHEDTAYFFDITSYLKYELADSYIDPDTGFLITLPSDELPAKLHRLIIDAQNPNTKLKIYYLSY